ncbi:MAG: hypothetical protein AB7U29_17660 [Desulfobulbus sp.]
MFDFLPVILYPLAALLGLVLIWYFASHVIANTGGWNDLSKSYPANTKISGTKFTYQSATTENANYSGVLCFTANNIGLQIELMSPFNWNSLPIFVPWSEIHGKKTKKLFWVKVNLCFQRVPGVKLMISEKLATRLTGASGGVWEFGSS